MPHRHPGPVFGCVLEGEYEWAIDDQPAKKLKVGDTFYEPAMCLHRVFKKPQRQKQNAGPGGVADTARRQGTFYPREEAIRRYAEAQQVMRRVRNTASGN
jgi:hypothetical protein